MLVALKVRDLAVIESLEISFAPGFTVLTGETGAGKSILVDALTLVLGGRASSELIRSGAQSAEVSALFDLSSCPLAREFLSRSGFWKGEEEPQSNPSSRPDFGSELVVRRVISHSGKNRAWIGDQLATTGQLFALGRFLVDIYGQHEYQTLLQEERHLSLLDAFAGLGEKVAAYLAAYEEWRKLVARREALNLSEAQKREREDLLRFRVQELEAAGLKPGEDEELKAERERLRHADLLRETARRGLMTLYESDDSVVVQLRELLRALRSAAGHDSWFAGVADQVESAASALEDVAHELRGHGEGIATAPGRLQAVEERLEELNRLKRKYGEDIAGLLERLSEAKAELASLSRQEEELEELSRLASEAEEKARAMARELTVARQAAGQELSRRIVAELAGLGMEKARFETRIRPAGGSGTLGPHGADEVSFFLSPNPGEELKPLAKIASGGELSRIMLGLRAQLVAEGVATLVFDEVDQGIGGAVAEAVGKRMKKLSAQHQTLCVTHLPQIAALADHHLKVVKHQTRHRTWVEVFPLDPEARIEEISRMLAGEEITSAARAHARELLLKAGQDLSSSRPLLPSKNKSGERRKSQR